MRVWVLIAAILLGILGLLFTEALIGAVVGVPMLLFGFILFLYGLFAKEKQVTSVTGQTKSDDETTRLSMKALKVLLTPMRRLSLEMPVLFERLA